MIQVIHRAFNILELLAENADRELGLSEIADSLELNHGTCANILRTLVGRGYVEHVTSTKRGYKLGPQAYRLADSRLRNTELIDVARSTMESLGAEIGEQVILSVVRNDKRVVLHEIPCTRELQVRTAGEASVFRTTTGRMILSHYPARELDELIKRVGLPTKEDWPEARTKADLVRLLGDIRGNGVEVYCNRNHVAGLAVPIFKDGEVIASLGVYLPEIRFSPAERPKLISLLKEAAAEINGKLNS